MGEQQTILCVLRGRPGLGHVIPGLAIAGALERRGARTHVLTYGAGASFYRHLRTGDWSEAEVSPTYSEWPGLDIYEHGVRQVAELARLKNASLLLFGGEYTLPPVAAALGVKSACIFNPEIFERVPRNEVPGALIGTLLSHCDALIALSPLAGREYLSAFGAVKDRVVGSGPFWLQSVGRAAPMLSTDRVAVVANGGGTHFPKFTASYSASGTLSRSWKRQTEQFTIAAVEACQVAEPRFGRVVVYSGLSDRANAAMARRFSSDARVDVRSVSADYYADLHRAELVVSRAGLGFLTDLRRIDAPAVLWPLAQHEEQLTNARTAAQTRPGTTAVDSLVKLRKAILKLRAAGIPTKRCIVDTPCTAAEIVAERLLALAER
jgi:hypothetical protein